MMDSRLAFKLTRSASELMAMMISSCRLVGRLSRGSISRCVSSDNSVHMARGVICHAIDSTRNSCMPQGDVCV